MKKIKKIIFALVILVIVLVIVAAIVVGTSLDKIVKTAIETVAPKITQTTVTLDGVKISLLSGSAGVNGLVVGNPLGYKSPQAISISSAAVSISPGSLLSDKIVVKSIEVRGPEITFEGNPLGDNNLTKIRDNASSGAAAATASPAGKKAGKKLEVDDFLLTGAKVHVQITGLGSREFNLTLPDIHLANLGTGSEGITTVDLTKTLLTEITSATVKAVAESAGNLGKNAATKVMDEGVSQGVDKIKKGFGGIFGK